MASFPVYILDFKGGRKEYINRNATFVIFAFRGELKNIIVPYFFSAKERMKSRGLRLTFQAQPCKKIFITVLILFDYPIYSLHITFSFVSMTGYSARLDPDFAPFDPPSIFWVLKKVRGVNISSRHEKLTQDTLHNVWGKMLEAIITCDVTALTFLIFTQHILRKSFMLILYVVL